MRRWVGFEWWVNIRFVKKYEAPFSRGFFLVWVFVLLDF